MALLTRIIAVTAPAPGIHSKFKRRLEHVKNTLVPSLKAIGLQPEIFPAIIGGSVTVADGAIGWRGMRLKLGSGCIGNLLSNYELWRLADETNQPVLILEDDAILSKDNSVVSALAVFTSMSDPDDILFLLGQNPSVKDTLKRYAASEVKVLGGGLARLWRTADLSCTAAYCVKPAAARALMKRLPWMPTRPTDGFVHQALRTGDIGVIVQENPAQGFMLNENWAEWNHKHDPNYEC
jgi:GR25 family glycosyltransferase involved in LPS biosynthesis